MLPSNYLRWHTGRGCDRWSKGWHMVSSSITSTIVPASKRTEPPLRGGSAKFCPSYTFWPPLPSCAVMRGTGRNKKVPRPEMVLGTLPPPRLGSRHAGLITREKRVYPAMCSRDFRDPIVDVARIVVSRCASFRFLRLNYFLLSCNVNLNNFFPTNDESLSKKLLL